MSSEDEFVYSKEVKYEKEVQKEDFDSKKLRIVHFNDVYSIEVVQKDEPVGGCEYFKL